MRRVLPLLPIVGVLAISVPCHAKRIRLDDASPAMATTTTPTRIAQSDLVVVGRFVRFEDVMRPKPDANQVAPLAVALVEVREVLYGIPGVSHVRIGLGLPAICSLDRELNQAIDKLAELVDGSNHAGQGIPPFFDRAGGVAIFVLARRPGDSFHVLSGHLDLVAEAENASFATTVASIRVWSRLLGNPRLGLESKDTAERFLTASMVVTRYRSRSGEDARTVEVDADTSRLVLRALAESRFDRSEVNRPSPRNVFHMLDLREADGWNTKLSWQNDPERFDAAAKAWLQRHADSFRIRRFLRDE